jgi:hypothetical protein
MYNEINVRCSVFIEKHPDLMRIRGNPRPKAKEIQFYIMMMSLFGLGGMLMMWFAPML